jgi:hypothetical protein
MLVSVLFHNEARLLHREPLCEMMLSMPQAWRSRVRFLMRSLDFSIVLTLLAVVWPWNRLSL